MHVNLEAAPAWLETVAEADRGILDEQVAPADCPRGRPSGERTVVWTPRSRKRWARTDPRPLSIDDDALAGDPLLAVRHQLRSGYENPPDGFPHSIVLRDARDLRAIEFRRARRTIP